MSWQDAPLYVRAHDLARDLHRQLGHGADLGGLGASLCADARRLLHCVSLALAFPNRRPVHQEEADEAILRLRTSLRLAADLDVLRAGGARQAQADLLDMGRMLGGWRKREARRQAALRAAAASGGGPLPPPGG